MDTGGGAAVMRYGDDEPHRTGPSKKWMEEDLRRAVMRTGGSAVANPSTPRDKNQEKYSENYSQPPAKPPSRPPASSDIRYVEPVKFTGKLNAVQSAPPKFRLADPTVLRIEASYQRDLSKKSLQLIQRIIAEWDWAKFKTPICAQTPAGLFVIDGQHTAIAAASHPEIKQIPIMIVEAADVERRAAAFVAHNRDRVTMTPAQILYGEVTAGDKDARGVLGAVQRAGGSVPRSPIGKRDAKPGQVTAVGDIRAIYKAFGPATLERIVRIAVLSKHAPVSLTMLRSIRAVVTGDLKHASDTKIAGALAAFDDFEHAAQKRAAALGGYRFTGGAALLTERLRVLR